MKRDNTSYHNITCDSNYMAQIGLSNFTSGELYAWWNQKDPTSTFYVNRGYIDIAGPADLLKANDDAYNIVMWDADNANYVQKDINSPSFFIQTKTKGVFDKASIGVEDFAGVHIEPTANDNIYADTALSPISVTGIVSSVIEHNNLVRLKYLDEGRDLLSWTEGATFLGTQAPLTLDQVIQKTHLINAIKTSKSGCLSWSVDLLFNLNLNSLGQCRHTETVTFSLKLHDYKANRDTRKGISFFNGNDPIISTPRNITGQNGLTDRGGMVPSKPIVAEIDLHYDESVGKFKSGTKQVVGIIAADIGPYTGGTLTSTDIQGADSTSILRLIFGNSIPSGLAYPILMQNSNPKIWTIPFKQENGCRTSNEKVSLRLLNFANKTFHEGDRVLLTNIVGNYWVPQDFGIDQTTTETSLDFGNNWTFNYLMTNRDAYFRLYPLTGNPTDNSQFQTEFYESSFIKAYYQSMVDYYAALNPAYAVDADLNNPQAPTFSVNSNGYRHITAFDFMGTNIGGTRGAKHGIAQTNFYYDYTGQSLGGTDGVQQYGFETQYFGCLFPAGYTVDPSIHIDTQAQVFRSVNDYTGGSSYFNTTYATTDGQSTTTAPFALGNSANNIGGTDGMFSAALQAVSYPHLPADIVSVASGSPIMKFGELCTNHTLSSDLFADVKDYFNNPRGCWLERQSDLAEPFVDAYQGIVPKNKSRVQFRPLSMETYAQFEGDKTSGSIDRIGHLGVSPAFGSKARNKVNDGLGTYSSHVDNRGGISYPSNPIRYGSFDQSAAIPGDLNQSFGCALKTKTNNTEVFPSQIWDNDYANEPADAVGIITACCDASFNSTIFPITVQAFLGIGNFSSNFSNGGNGGSIILGQLVGVDTGGLGSSLNIQYWGATPGINRFSTTELWVKAYWYHPRELTVFDPRFFSVHHYNYGATNQVDRYTDLSTNWYIRGTLATDASLNSCGFGNLVDLDKSTIYGTYRDTCVPYLVYDSVEPLADYRIPTYSNAVSNNNFIVLEEDNTPIPLSTNIYKDSPVRQRGDWIVEPKLRGKLLPFTYNKTSIGVSGIGLSTLKSISFNALTTDTAQDWDCIIKNGGTGYVNDETFTLAGGTGSGVLLSALTNGGSITGFKLLNTGEGYSSTDFIDSSEPLKTAGVSQTSIIKVLTRNGTGFQGYITKGCVVSNVHTVNAPRKVLEPTLISPNTSAGGLISSIVTQNLTINAADKAADNNYTLFFHFHNDCSYTLFFGSDYGSTLPTYSQHITVSLGS